MTETESEYAALRDARIAELERELSTKDDKDAAQQVPGLGDKAIPARTVLEWMEEAKEDMQDWACYASEYFQEKHNLAADLGKMNARIAILERILVDEPPNMPAPKASG